MPIAYSPMGTLHFDSCHIARTTDLVHSLQLTAAQKRPLKKKPVKSVPLVQPSSRKPTSQRNPPSAQPRKKLPFLQKLEVSGNTCFVDLKFMEDKGHDRAERQIRSLVPNISLDMSDIYYFD